MADYIYDIADRFYNSVASYIEASAYVRAMLRDAEEMTGIPGSYIITGITVVLGLFLFFMYGTYVICDVSAILFPAYKSFKALEENDLESSLYWVKYWIIFGLFHIVEHILDPVLKWLPGYQIAKFLFLVWCFAPVQNNGSVVIYEQFIRPVFQKNVETVDHMIKTVKSLTQGPAVR